MSLESVLNELIEMQKKRLLSHGRRFVPTLTPEDMLQPMDYEVLETNPEFRYEEGILAGLLSAEAALRREPHFFDKESKRSRSF